MCLLEVSSHGLLESELLEILADEDNLMPLEMDQEKGEKLVTVKLLVSLLSFSKKLNEKKHSKCFRQTKECDAFF
jgi:hypothetical protein